MSKAILVIDMPDDCAQCPCFLDHYGNEVCKVVKREIENYRKKPEWCPLREVPTKRDKEYSLNIAIENDCYDGTTEDKAYLKGLDRGYNSCIDELVN